MEALLAVFMGVLYLKRFVRRPSTRFCLSGDEIVRNFVDDRELGTHGSGAAIMAVDF
jgi:hypothetical protein